MDRKPNIALVGVTGVVGTTFLKVLEDRNFPFENLYTVSYTHLDVYKRQTLISIVSKISCGKFDAHQPTFSPAFFASHADL